MPRSIAAPIAPAFAAGCERKVVESRTVPAISISQSCLVESMQMCVRTMLTVDAAAANPASLRSR